MNTHIQRSVKPLLLALSCAFLTGVLPAYSQCTPPPPGMVSWWPGDGNANDIEDGNNGTLQNGADFVTGEVSQAFHCDSNTVQFVSIPYAANLDFETTNTFSVDAWVRTTETGGNMFILANRQVAVPFKGYALMVNNGQEPKCYPGDPTPPGAGTLNFLLDASDTAACPRDHAAIVYGATAVNDGQWHHVAATYDGSGTAAGMQVYVDGALDTMLILDDNLGTNSMVHSDGFSIGAGSGNGPQPFNGDIDEVEVFSRVLSGAEIQAIVDAGSFGKCKTPVASVVASPTRIREGGSSTYNVSVSPKPQQNLRVSFSISGTATLGTDYTLTGAQVSGNRGRVTILAGQSAATVTLNALSDGITEGTETAIMTLSRGSAYGLGRPNKATVRISDP